MLRDSLQGFYYSLQVFYKASPENEKTLLYIKLRQAKYVYFPFLLSSSFLQLFFSFSVSSLFGTQQQLPHPPVKSSTLPLRNMPVFQGVVPRHTVSLHPASSLFGTQQQLTHPPVKSSTLPLWKNHVFSGYCLFNVLTSFCLGCLWFGAHPHYLLNPYLHLYYVWSISIAKIRRYPKYIILCMVYFYSERPSHCRERQLETLVELIK